jgi:hypothetical protein
MAENRRTGLCQPRVNTRNSTIGVVCLLAAAGCSRSDEAPESDGADTVFVPTDGSGAGQSAGGSGNSGAGDDDDTQTPGDDTQTPGDDTNSGGAGGSCDGQCLALPDGWSGPVQISAGACGGDFPSAVVQAHRGLTAAAASCGCACGDSVGVGCGNAQELDYDTASGFACPALAHSAAGLSCQNIPGFAAEAGDRFAFEITSPFSPPGSCPAMAQVDIEPWQWAETLSICGLAAPWPSCADATLCAPDVIDGDLCVYQEGDGDCGDAGAFTERVDGLFASVADDRGCTPCTCGDPEGHCRVATISFYDGTCINSNKVGEQYFGASQGCAALPGGPVSRFRIDDFQLPLQDATCTPSASLPTGGATAQDPITVCCLPG